MYVSLLFLIFQGRNVSFILYRQLESRFIQKVTETLIPNFFFSISSTHLNVAYQIEYLTLSWIVDHRFKCSFPFIIYHNFFRKSRQKQTD